VSQDSKGDRLTRAFASGRKTLVIYVTCGDPTVDATVDVVLAAAKAGADVIELGVPFSEPNADGPAIQRAMERALAKGAGLPAALEVTRRVRKAGCEVPIVLFGYYNPVFVRGAEAFCKDAKAAGADAALIVDLPVDEIDELLVPARAAGLGIIPLAAPTSGADRLKRIAAVGAPFVYYVSYTGITGAALKGVPDVAAKVAALRAAGVGKVAVGFGISTPADARTIAEFADGVVVGSAVVRAIESNPGREAAAVSELVASLRAAI
jgi:tryptophan synthase alpha chain